MNAFASHTTKSSLDLALDNHLKNITELQALLTIEETALLECLSQKKIQDIQ